MEFAENGDLEKEVQENVRKQQAFEETVVWKVLIQILIALIPVMQFRSIRLSQLHEFQIVHRDIKGANIFQFPNQVFKLADLNVAKIAK
jgi:serine/threonine protein kinase